MEYDHRNDPAVMATTRHLAHLHEVAPAVFAEHARAIAASVAGLRDGKLPDGIEPRTLAALGLDREGLAKLKTFTAEDKRQRDAVAALSDDQRKALAVLQPDPEERARFLARRAGATP